MALIRFTVSYTNRTGAVITKHNTTQSAYEEAREYIRKGYHDVMLTDLATGSRSSSAHIKKDLERVDEFYRDAL